MPDVEAVAPTFFVTNVHRAAEWYRRVLGFKITFETDGYCGVALDAITIHLAQRGSPSPGVVYKGACYLRLRDGVDEYVRRIQAAGHPLTAPLQDHAYGMREATVRDLDGNDIYIGQPVKPPRR